MLSHALRKILTSTRFYYEMFSHSPLLRNALALTYIIISLLSLMHNPHTQVHCNEVITVSLIRTYCIHIIHIIYCTYQCVLHTYHIHYTDRGKKKIYNKFPLHIKNENRLKRKRKEKEELFLQIYLVHKNTSHSSSLERTSHSYAIATYEPHPYLHM